MRFILLLTAILMLLPASGQAGEILACGVPVSVRIETDPGFTYCDIYQRQLAYYDEAKALDRQMKERQINFAAPRIETLKRYQEGLKALNARREAEAADIMR